MNLLYANEPAGKFPPSWYVESAPPFPAQPVLEGETRADVCIVGAGFTGLSAALHLAERGASVTVLEAQRVGWGASGRNGGQIGVGQRVDQPELERLAGETLAREAWEIGLDAARLVRELVTKHAIPCALKPGVMYVNHRRRYDRHSRDYAEHMRARYGHEVAYLPPEEVAQRLGASGIHGGTLDMAGGHLHPLAYARGLAFAALSAGARIHEGSEALEIDGTTVRTARGAVRADRVIVACNGYLGGLLPEVAGKVMPINNFVLATEPLSEDRARSLIRDDVAVADSRFVVNYFRLSEDRRMLFGGGESYGWKFPQDLKGLVRGKMLKLFPQLSDVRGHPCLGRHARDHAHAAAGVGRDPAGGVQRLGLFGLGRGAGDHGRADPGGGAGGGAAAARHHGPPARAGVPGGDVAPSPHAARGHDLRGAARQVVTGTR